MAPFYEFGIILLMAAPMIIAENATWGALITYNQYSDILVQAPTCFKNGCGSSPLTSMSSSCDPTAACYPVWHIMNQEWQQNWCDSVPGDDVACRISGWPILNATAACDMSPNAWLFGSGCCVDSDQPSQLSTFIESLCNNSWREQFVYYDGFASQDWPGWELPWNWTVAPDNTLNPKCPAMSHYLGIFVIENFVFLIFVFIYGVIQLWEIGGRDRNHRHPFVYWVLTILLPFTKLKHSIERFLKFCFSWSPDSGKGYGVVVSTISMAIFFSGIQFGFNFASAYIIKLQPGYEHVPAALLALLFCCRPRIGWFACLLSRTPLRILREKFHLLPPDNPYEDPRNNKLLQGQLAVAKVAIGSALGEVIMQCLGSYFLGKAAHVGVTRGFYDMNSLSPYWRGGEARMMYVGAMFWLSASIFIVLTWLFIVICHAEILRFFAITEDWLKHFIQSRVSEERRPTIVNNWINSGAPTTTNTARSRGPFSETTTLISEIHRPTGHPNRSLERVEIHRPSGLRGGLSTMTSTGTSSSTEYDSVPMRSREPPQITISPSSQGTRVRTQRNGYEAVPMIPEMAEVGPQPYDDPPEENFRGRGPAMLPAAEEPYYIQRVNPRLPPDNDYTYRTNPRTNLNGNTAYQGVNAEEIEHRGASPPYDPDSHLPWELHKWQKRLMLLGVILGLISYIAQWLFWAGFVHTSGDRFCPPKIGITGTFFTLAGVLGLGAMFSLH